MLCSRRLIVSRKTPASWLGVYIDLDLTTGKWDLDQTIGKRRQGETTREAYLKQNIDREIGNQPELMIGKIAQT